MVPVSPKGVLGVKAKVSDDISAGAEFAAYNSTGDEVLDAYYGVSAPYLSNFFTQNPGVGFGLQGANNQPWTRLNLDNFWMQHNPSGLKAIVGAYDAKIDSLIYAGQLNPNVNGPKFLNNYGFNVTGTTNLFAPMEYEVLYTKLADGAYNVAPPATTDYRSDAYGVDLKWKFNNDKGNFKINFITAQNNPNNFGAGPDFQFNATSIGFADALMGGSIANWVNPTSVDPLKPAMVGSTFGPQSQRSYGLTFNYDFKDNAPLKAKVELASSTYKPTRSGAYTSDGGALLVGLASTLMQGKLDLGLDYVSTDPNYDPMLLQYPGFGTANYNLGTNYLQGFERFPDFNYFAGMYQLHDSEKYTNNRQGLKFKAAYKFMGEDGLFKVNYSTLTQTKTSAFNTNSGTGYEPGFIETVFSGYNPNIALGDPKGKEQNFGAGVDYKFSGTKLKLALGYGDWKFKRDAFTNDATNLSKVDMDYNKWNLGLSYPLTEKFALKAGYEVANIKQASGNKLFMPDVTLTQSVPCLGFDYQISKNTSWGLGARFNSFTQKLDPNGGINEYKWTGTQLISELKVSF